MFSTSEPQNIVEQLKAFIPDAGESQIRAGKHCIPPLQREVRQVLEIQIEAASYSAILEYELPMESRRTDVVILTRGTVLVLELKGKTHPSQADMDQAAGYGRDLRSYHRECANRPVLVDFLSESAYRPHHPRRLSLQ